MEISTKLSRKAKNNFHNALVNSNHRHNQETPGKRGLQVRDWQDQTHLHTAPWLVLAQVLLGCGRKLTG